MSRFARRWTRRMRDLAERTVGGAALVGASPVIGAVALAVKATSRGPALYQPEMLGRRKRAFRMKKFRSMVVDASAVIDDCEDDVKVKVEADDPRFTPIGKYIRVGFDELPQLINIVLGGMALVGPRPDPLWLEGRYTPEIDVRFKVKPGITGLAQVLDGRYQPGNVVYYLDTYYVRNQSTWLDGAIVLLTVPYVLGIRGPGRWLCERLMARCEEDLEAYNLRSTGDADRGER